MRNKRMASLLLALALCLTLLPPAARAEEGEFTITFDASPGAFRDGSTTRTVQTTSGQDEAAKHLVSIPEEHPQRSGFTFRGWAAGDGSPVTNVRFTADATVTAQWDPDSNHAFPPDPGGAAASPDGPFTVKFDLNYADPKWSEIPDDQIVRKGSAVSLPDGTKLTPPSSAYVFYAWCLLDSDGKLFPWDESHAVTSDMTLYAGWIKKGKVIVDGVAMDAPSSSKPAEAAKPSEPTEPTEPAEPAEVPPAPAFTDVSASSPFAPAVAWAVEKGVTNGKTASTFAPGESCTRAQIVTFLWRAAGSPEPTARESEYMDAADTDAYYYKAVQWAAEMGMEESGTFRPGEPCTRGQAMYFIWRAQNTGSSAGSAPSFTDLSRDSLYYDAVLWAVGQGVTTGTGDGSTFSPDSPCTRGQIMTFLYRAYENK